MTLRNDADRKRQRDRIADDLSQNRTCSCGKTCKNATDLQIHQTKMGCRQDEQRSLQCEVERKAYQEVQSWEKYNSALNTCAQSRPAPGMKITKERIRQPRMNDEGVWRQLDEDLSKINLKGEVGAKLESLHTCTCNES